MGIYGHEKAKAPGLWWVKSHVYKVVTMRVVMEVVVESYLVFPWASEGPLCILGMPRWKTFWLRLIPHTLLGLSQEWGDFVKRISSRNCGGVREWSASAGWSTLKSTKGDTPKEGYHPCVGWLELVLGVLLALDVLGWRTSKKETMWKMYVHCR